MKTLNSLRALVAMLVLALPATALAGATRIQLVGNISLVPHHTQLSVVSASASEGGGNFGPDKAIDGNTTTTRWGTGASDPQWITLDLGSAQELSRVVIDWEVASAAAYEIRGSNDNINWDLLASKSSSSSAQHRIDTVSISGNYQYVQMFGQARTTIYGYSIWEMYVYGPSGSLGPDTDNDGVGDNLDRCPGTPANTPVENDGCEVVTGGSCQVGAIGGYDAPQSYSGMSLLWSDEFNGAELNFADWTHEIGTGCANNLCGWGNNELQYYQPANTCVGDGALTIEAKQETVCNPTNSSDCGSYTSSRIKTQGKQFGTYGRIDIRAVLPEGQGLWPAAWMLGESITSVGWPASGEIDIMEMVGGSGREDTVHGTVHWEGTSGAYWNYGQSKSLPFNGYTGTYADQYHVYSIVWDSNEIKWYVNNIFSHAVDITPGHMSEFHQNFFLLFNIAVGGNWPGSPNGSTVFPQKMIIDYVRWYQ